MRSAAIEIGSNSVKLLVADRTSAGLREVRTRVRVTRVSQGMTHRLRPTPMKRTLDAVESFHRIARREGARRIVVAGTAALRRARNAPAFLERCPIPVRILSAREEARLSFLGGAGCGAATAVDIGGASTEVMRGTGGKLRSWKSFPFGVVTLTEKNIRTMRQYAARRFRRLARSRGRLVVIGGTAGTMAALMLGRRRITSADIHGKRLPMAVLRRTLDRLSALPLARRRKVRGLEPDRADIIPAGLAILIAAMEHFRTDTAVASARGVRHGLLLESR
ncbi:MAG: Ppx/GppA phosphatase family protein [Planctomycetota bacterium]|jgi:exopolyphosphatase/guanosine-5'-triphosphate,3'-diphosphate pyrophosphatase